MVNRGAVGGSDYISLIFHDFTRQLPDLGSSMLLDAPDRSPSAWHGGAINSLCVRAAVIAAPGGGGSLAQWRPLAPETNKADR
jgi:hypothetical protein